METIMKLTTQTTAATLMATTALAGIETRTVSFENEGAILSGTLYLPEGHDGSPLPTVLVTGAWTSVQEQMPANYARKMAERGFAAFTFDFRGWGKSGDLPQNVRFVESPSAKTSDIRAAFEFVATLPEVDGAQINGLGICASAGYMIDAAAGNDLVHRVGLVAPWLQNDEIAKAVYGGAEGVAGLLQVSRAAEDAGGQIIPAAGPEGAEGVLMPIGGYYYEADRGAIPEYDNRWNNAGWEGWLTYHPADNPQRLQKPLAIVHSESAAIPQGVRSFLSGFAGEATMQWLEGVTQFDFYDKPADVTRAAETMAEHFRPSAGS
jgi:dienelactone hydrolase